MTSGNLPGTSPCTSRRPARPASSQDVPEDVLEREKEIYRAQALETGKPEAVVEKIMEGKIAKFLKEVCLMNQAYVKNPDMTIADYLNEVIAKTGENIVIKRFARFQLGE
jgi:elongation factor Ts